MSYEKMMKREKGHRHDRDFQTIFHNAFEGDNNVKSGIYYAEQAMKNGSTCHIAVQNKFNGNFIRISPNFQTEDEAIEYIKINKLEEKYPFGMICTENKLILSKW